jgi:predicted  nucleic acid-binding Zn-ribbon protein
MELALKYIQNQVQKLKSDILDANKDISELMNEEKKKQIEIEVA